MTPSKAYTCSEHHFTAAGRCLLCNISVQSAPEVSKKKLTITEKRK